MEQFAIYEKQEQWTVQQRRQKEIEHKNEVERLWKIRLEIYKQEKKKEMEKDHKQQDIERMKEIIIQQVIL